MRQPRLQISVAAFLGVVACVAVNIWLFRVGVLWGILGVNVTKHVLTAYLCQVLGLDRGPDDAAAAQDSVPAPVPHGAPQPAASASVTSTP